MTARLGTDVGVALTALGISASALMAASGGPTHQAPGPERLEYGTSIERETSGTRKDVYETTIGVGRLARIVVEARAVEVVVRLLDAAGALVFEADDSANRGLAELEFVAEGPSVHRVEVEPRYPRAPSGTYRIRIAELREASERDRRLFEARRQLDAAGRLHRAAAYEDARIRAERARGLLEAVLGPEHPEVAISINVLGLIWNAMSDFSQADAMYRWALALNERAFGIDHPAVAGVLDNLATNYREQGSLAEAQRAAERALAIREARLGARHALTAASWRTLSDIHADKGDYSKARTATDQALAIAREVHAPDGLELAEFVYRAARDQAHQGDYARAEQLFTETLHVREGMAGKDSLPAADSVYSLALVALRTGRALESEALHARALAIKERILGPDHADVAHILNNLGLIAYRRRDYQAAERFHTRALRIRDKVLGPAHQYIAHSLNNLGLVYWRQREYPKAAEFFTQALEMAEKVHGPESLALTSPLGNLGIVYKETGDYDRAEANYTRALAIRERVLGREHPELRVTIESLGILYRDRGDYVRAEPMFLRTLEITERSFGPDHPDVIRHLQNLAQLQVAAGDATGALAGLQRSAAIEEAQLPLNLAVGSERQKLAYFRPFARTLEEAVSFHIQQDATGDRARDLAAGLVLQRKGRVFDAMADSAGALWSRSGPEDRARLDRLRDVTSRLSALVLGGPRRLSMAEHQQRIRELTTEREQLEDEISRRSAGRYARTSPVTLAAIQAAVPAGAALIEFVVYRPYDPAVSFESQNRYGQPRYAAYVISSAGDVRWADLGGAAGVDAAVDRLRQALQDPRRDDVKALARALDSKIMQPIRALTGDATRFLVSPDGQLALVPFEALVDEDDVYLVERFSFSYLSAGRDLLRLQVPRASRSAPVLVADPLFGEPASPAANVLRNANAPPAARPLRSITTGADLSSVYFAPIAGTAYEARSIQYVFPDARMISGAHATESALRDVQAPSILHIATHGFFLQEPDSFSPEATRAPASGARAVSATAKIANPLLRSGLALAGANLATAGSEDGILTALEAAHLNLWGTKLVTLSACDTGIGVVRNGEGVYGLRRSIFLAGAESLVMSLWAVSDYVTREMMTEYYKGLKVGLGRGDALRKVQLSMLKRKGREHPFYWASFIQAGDWRPLDGGG